MLLAAGCLAASASTESAMDLEDQARDRADEMLDDPRLIGLWGVETPKHAESNTSELRVNLDDNPGDGNAAGWAYRFVGTERTGIVVVADELGVVAEFWTDRDEGDLFGSGDSSGEARPEALTWEVDSGEAADILADNETWPEMTDAHGVSWELEGEGNETIWNVEAEEVTFGEEAGEDYHAVVDAQSGEILRVAPDEEFFPGPGSDAERPEREAPAHEGGCNSEEESGQLTPLGDVSTDEVDLEEHGYLTFTVSYQGAGPLDYAILDEDGETVFEDGTTMAGQGTIDNSLDGVEEGEYTLATSTSSGSANVDLRLTAVWGSGAQECDFGFGPGSPTASEGPTSDEPGPPAWVYVGRTLGVPQLG